MSYVRTCLLNCLVLAALASAGEPSAQNLSRRVTIYRDSFGVPHIDAADTVSAAFGFIYAQCEDYFWQVEDSLVWGMGRYAEIYGKKSVETDVLTHSFEIPRRSRDEFNKQPEYYQQVARAMAEACNLYLATHPEVKPRLVTKFEPWHFLAFNRRVWIEIAFTSNHVSRAYMPNRRDEVYEQIGSNAWAIAPSKTKSGNAMLFINPHQPWYGYGQWYEGHIRTGDGIDFYGASFFGSPMLSIGHNHQCGWTFTVNQPDVIDVWRVRFDDSSRPNHYRHGDAYREAAVWTETIKVRGEKDRQYTFRKTHQGPILRELEDGMFEAVQVAGIYESDFLGQVLELVRSKSVHDFKKAMGRMSLPIFNGVSADRDGNILYLYNGVVPKRDARFDWAKPVDGTDPATDWQGIHTVEDLPQVLNPPTGYVQSCNSSPFTTTDDASPFKLDYPKYMVMDADVDMRRAKVSRHILRQADDITFEDLERLAFDTLMYWPMSELPRLRRAFAKLKESKPDLAARVQEYMDHFEGWDYRVAPDCTRSPLCVAWYEELYGFGYPAETLKERFQKDPDAKFEALAEAAKKIADNFGTWKVKYADIYRIQRHHNVADLIQIPLSDRKPSIPCVGAPGPLGIVFTVYYSPSVYVPIVREMRKHYAVVGTSYTGIVEFKKDGVASKSLIQFGSSSDPKSPHYDDQAKLFSQSQMKKTLFDWKEIESTCRKYHPGEKG